MKKYLLSIIILSLSYFSATAHVEHYQKYDFLDYDLFRNDKKIGQHKYIFERSKSVNSIAELRGNFRYHSTNYESFKRFAKSEFKSLSFRGDNVFHVYPHTLFCDEEKERCFTHNDTDVFYMDTVHPSVKGSEMIVDLIMEQIEKAEVNIREN